MNNKIYHKFVFTDVENYLNFTFVFSVNIHVRNGIKRHNALVSICKYVQVIKLVDFYNRSTD